MNPIQFIKQDGKVLFVYHYGDGADSEFYNLKELDQKSVHIKHRIFTFDKEDLFPIELVDKSQLEYANDESFGFLPTIYVFGTLVNDYYKIRKGVLSGFDIHLHKDFKFESEHFIAETNISIFKQISEILKSDVYIGGSAKKALPLEVFYNLIKEFPTTHEKKLYAQKEIYSRTKEYFDPEQDSDKKFNTYRNRKTSKKGVNLMKIFSEAEVYKYETILEKLTGMLSESNSYSEKRWQDEILEIILLLYPKDIKVVANPPMKTSEGTSRFADIGLLDVNGHLDIIEIKKPEAGDALGSIYRKNFIPSKELSGTIMQLEKYIFHLNRWGKIGEDSLTKKYKKELPDDFSIKIVNPKGFIIMGRETNLDPSKITDYEVIKRKYNNVIDIISYDDLLKRLNTIIEQIKKH